MACSTGRWACVSHKALANVYQASNFLNKMAFEVDIAPHVEEKVVRHGPRGAEYDSMRRKWQMRKSE